MKCYSSSDFQEGSSNQQEDISEDSILNGFIDENICGESASCIVYLMHWQGWRVAVKRLRAEYRTTPEYVAAYRKEYQLGQQLKHDGLPIYRDFHKGSDEVYIVMDFIDGISLSDFLETDTGQVYFSFAENVKRFLTQLLDVVSYLHRSGMIHCDIKPANIMLRHSDRSVMMLDLDKCYTDSLNRTHGGTAILCNPLAGGETPTTAKDFIAIGNLIDYIAERVPKSTARRFRKFRDACRSKDATDERLSQVLRYRSKSYLWAIGVIAISIACGAYYMIASSANSEEEQTSQQALPVNNSDTVRIIENIPSGQNAIQTSNQHQSLPKVIAADFDNRMSEFIREAENAIATLRKGNATDKQIHNLVDAILESHSVKYQSLMKAYKSENPDMSGFDVEMAVARAYERSKASALLQQFTQAAADTLTRRHPDLYSDY